MATEMAKRDKNRQLSVEQENAIDLLLQGRRDREVAEAVGVARQTVTGWRNDHALFITTLNGRRREVWGSQVDRLRQIVGQAVDVLNEDLGCEDLRLRQSAAIHVLRCVGLYGVNLEPTGPEDIEEFETFLKEEGNNRAMRQLTASLF
tara:strand:- start:93 stop:536 length:444 start_codon:yes stop_codon:yes gene_type:complete